MQQDDPSGDTTPSPGGAAPPAGATTTFYRRFVGPLLLQDEGADAERLSQLTLATLAQVSLRRDWPLVRDTLQGLAAERAALNRMGFNNDGAQAVRRTLERQGLPPPGRRPAVLGLNIGKSRSASLELAPDDYASSLALLAPLADYAVINVSSPNTPGLRDLQEESQLRRLVERLRRLPACPPLLVKIAPDLEDDAIDAIARLAYEEGLAGVIAVNTSQHRLGLEQRRLPGSGLTLAEEAGGLSGRPLRARALEVLRRLRATAGPALPLIGVGGIDSAETAWERIAAGASLVQVYTGWIYEGPALVPQILEGLLRQLDRHGLRTIGEAVGCGRPWA